MYYYNIIFEMIKGKIAWVGISLLSTRTIFNKNILYILTKCSLSW